MSRVTTKRAKRVAKPAKKSAHRKKLATALADFPTPFKPTIPEAPQTPVVLAPPRATVRPEMGEKGVSGTVIWSGSINAEANQRLQHERGYGTPGSTDWGEWEKLERTDHAVAGALGLLAAPLRDSEIEVESAPEEESEGEFEKEEDEGEKEELESFKGLFQQASNGLPEVLDNKGEKPSAPKPPASSEEELLDVMSGKEEKSQNKVIADFVRDNLQKWIAPQWSTLLEQIVHYGLAYGFYLGEEVWDTRDDSRVPGGKAIYLKKLAQRLPSSILSNGWVEENGELKAIRQAGVRDGRWLYNIELPASKCLLATWNRNGNNYRGFSAFRPVWYIGQMRADLLKILAIGSAREALGILAAEIDKDVSLSDEQRDALQDFIENAHYHESLAIQLPPGVRLNWLTSGGGNKGHVLELWKSLGLAIYETVQAQQTTLGTGETGSRAVGEVHDASKNSYVSGVRAWVEAVLNGIGDQPYTGLVRKIVDINFGPQKEYPKVRIVLRKPEISVDVYAASLKTLVDGGIITIDADIENDARQRFGFAPVDEESREAEKKRKADIAASIAGARPAPFGGQQKPEEEDEGVKPESTQPSPEEVAKAAMKFSEGEAFVPRRALRPNETFLNLAEIDAFYEGGREKFEAMVRPIVETMVRDARGSIREAMKDGDPSELAKLKFNSKLLAKAVEVFIETARVFGYRQARLEAEKQVRPGSARPALEMPGQLSEKAAKRLLFAFDPFKDDLRSRIVWKKPGTVPGTKLPSGGGELVIEELVTAQTKLVTDRITNRTKQQLLDAAIDAVRRGDDADGAIAQVLQQLEETKALRNEAAAVLSRSFSMGRQQYHSENESDIAYFELSAVLDRSTCGECEALDGTRFEPGSAEDALYQTPLAQCDGRQNCRCVRIAVMKEEA